MSFFVVDTKVIDLGGGNTVTIRKLNFGDMMKLWRDASLYDGPGETQRMMFNVTMARLSITSWEGPDFDGRGVSPENIDALPPQIMLKIVPEAVEFSQLSDDEKNE